MSQTYTKTQYDNIVRQRKLAWAKYYESEAQQAGNAVVIISGIQRTGRELVDKSSLPVHITQEYYDMAAALNKKYTCPV